MSILTIHTHHQHLQTHASKGLWSMAKNCGQQLLRQEEEERRWRIADLPTGRREKIAFHFLFAHPVITIITIFIIFTSSLYTYTHLYCAHLFSMAAFNSLLNIRMNEWIYLISKWLMSYFRHLRLLWSSFVVQMSNIHIDKNNLKGKSSSSFLW